MIDNQHETIKALHTALIEATEKQAKAYTLSREAKCAMEESSPRRADEWKNLDPEQKRAKYDAWQDKHLMATQMAEHDVALYNLYVKALDEVLSRALRYLAYDEWENPAFLEKWGGTPLRYKRFQAATFTWLPDGWSGTVYPTGDVSIYDENHKLVGEFTAWRFAQCEDGGFSDRTFNLAENVDSARSPVPAPDEIFAACEESFATKNAVLAMIDKVRIEADEAIKRTSIGIHAITEACTPPNYSSISRR